MKKLVMLVAGIILLGCQESEVAKSELTGNEMVFPLAAGSVYDISGTVAFKEKKDGTTLVSIALSGTDAGGLYPVHLHLGAISAADAAVAALLTPVDGATGKSETSFSMLADESPITYQDLKSLNACIKIHLAEAGPGRDIILAGGNIGSASSAEARGRLPEFGICKSE